MISEGAPVAPTTETGVSFTAVMMRVTGVDTDDVTGVVINVEVAEPVLLTTPFVASVAVTMWSPIKVQTAPTASVAQEFDVGVSNASLTTTLF